ncbi:hypothetical protein [Streptomyces sp. RFCAC02]|uniref:hypothetical protein n=1 Tax=Streptomyces sp. RFCAC02 TaxID=2499143 RepID=UPI00101EEABB|nr:hypothetical protein [Streptomyces sp. RFCAC02]
MTGGHPRRVRVTSPQTRIALARRRRPAHAPPPAVAPGPGPGDTDPAGTEAARTLFARQRRIALRTMAALGALLFGLSGLLAALPALDRITVLGFPASWLLLMAAGYPALLVIAVLHVRATEHAEDGARGAPPRHGGS